MTAGRWREQNSDILSEVSVAAEIIEPVGLHSADWRMRH
jgi:hypothetical protein